jgi:hypothetical protein
MLALYVRAIAPNQHLFTQLSEQLLALCGVEPFRDAASVQHNGANSSAKTHLWHPFLNLAK